MKLSVNSSRSYNQPMKYRREKEIELCNTLTISLCTEKSRTFKLENKSNICLFGALHCRKVMHLQQSDKKNFLYIVHFKGCKFLVPFFKHTLLISYNDWSRKSLFARLVHINTLTSKREGAISQKIARPSLCNSGGHKGKKFVKSSFFGKFRISCSFFFS